MNSLVPFPKSRKRMSPSGPRVDVRFGSLADILSTNRHVRFTPESGYLRCKILP
jgi:hypothetical protein